MYWLQLFYTISNIATYDSIYLYKMPFIPKDKLSVLPTFPHSHEVVLFSFFSLVTIGLALENLTNLQVWCLGDFGNESHVQQYLPEEWVTIMIHDKSIAKF